MRVILLLSAVLLSTRVLAQGIIPSGGRSLSMANASLCNTDVWAYHNNPAASGAIDYFSVGISYENRFCLKELQSQSIAIVFPLKAGTISMGAHSYGFKMYRSVKSGLGYSLRLTDKFYVGVQLNYQNIRLKSNYGRRNAMTAEAGLYYEISDKWKFGAAVFNIGRSRLLFYQNDRFSTVLRLGAAHTFSEDLLFSTEIEKNIENRLRIKTGMEYTIRDDFFILGGIANAPLELTFGFGIELNQGMLNFGSSFHQILGWSPHVSFVFKRDEN